MIILLSSTFVSQWDYRLCSEGNDCLIDWFLQLSRLSLTKSKIVFRQNNQMHMRHVDWPDGERNVGRLCQARIIHSMSVQLQTFLRPGILPIFTGKPEISVAKSNGSRHSVWEASENMDCDLRRCSFSTLFMIGLTLWTRFPSGLFV